MQRKRKSYSLLFQLKVSEYVVVKKKKLELLQINFALQIKL